MPPAHAVAIFLAGVGAGTINTLVGSGSLITFPTLLLLGYAPIPANVSNNLGMVAGGLSGSFGYRRELAGHTAFLRRYAPISLVGSVIGAVLLLVLPASAFARIVPILIGLALLLVVFGPRLQAAARSHHVDGVQPSWHTWALGSGVFVAAVYGGYFGAAQGVLLMGILSVLSSEHLQRLNGFKNVLALVVNAVAAVTFMVAAWSRISWPVVLLVGLGAFLGGFLGARVGRRMPSAVLRVVIIAIGVAAIVKLLWFS